MNGIATIDCHYTDKEIACAYQITEPEGVVWIETNTNHAFGEFENSLRSVGKTFPDVVYIIVTHVHLDHAGGAGKLLSVCPNATLLVHPKGKKHLVNPSRLKESSIQVYGKDAFEKLYGDIEPIPETRIRVMEDFEEISLGKRKFRFLHTRGHANHHFCIYESESNSIFTGDSYGLSYPWMKNGDYPFLVPTTTPTEFHFAEALKTLDKLHDTGATTAYLTHFGAIPMSETTKNQMKVLLTAFEDIRKEMIQELKAHKEESSVLSDSIPKMKNTIGKEAEQNFGNSNPDLQKKLHTYLKMDIELNCSGLLHSAKKEASPKLD